MLNGNIFIPHLVSRIACFAQRAVHLLGDIGFALFADRTMHPGQAFHLFHRVLFNPLRLFAHFGQQLGNQAGFVFQQRSQQMRLLQRLVGVFARQPLRGLNGFHAFLCISYLAHTNSPPYCGSKTDHL